MASLNMCCFIGNLGKDPETRYTQDGKAVTSFSIAVTEKWKKDGEQKEKTEWIRCVSFGRLAEVCAEYLVKGKSVYVSGKMRTRSYEKDGATRYVTEIEVREMQMLGSRQSQDNGQAQPPEEHPNF